MENHMENHAIVGRVLMMAVPVPVGSDKTQLHVPGEMFP